MEQLHSSSSGLDEAEASQRRTLHGSNTIAHEETQPLWRDICLRIVNPLNLLLLILALVSLLTGDAKAAALIAAMVLLSLVLATIQERRSSRAAAQLRAMVHTTATVLRPGAPLRESPLELLVPGDVVQLSAGDLIPADLRLLSAKDFFVNQASLTGEGLPVEKHAEVVAQPGNDPPSLTNICYMGTSVISGSGCGVVVLTGARAYFGSIAQAIAARRVPTSFEHGINRFTWLMIRFILVMAPLVFLINGFTKGNWLEALLFATAVAVGLTPEMLPMIVTVNLAKGALAMARKKVIVKRLNAIQNFGAMDVLCTDKTGTLTQGRVILERHVNIQGAEDDEVLRYAYLNSFFQSGLKNLMDEAVLSCDDSARIASCAQTHAKFDEVPFDFERRRMSVAVEHAGERILICKGAVREMLDVSSRIRFNGAVVELDPALRRQAEAAPTALSEDGFRVIAVAYRNLPPAQQSCAHADETDLILLGYIAFLDPPKDSAIPALAALAGHGVSVKVLTGDNDIVARRICKAVGLIVDRTVLGPQLEAMSAEEFAAACQEGQLFARLSPTQKAAIIECLQRQHHVVGFLGDGINDGPALKQADVGISVDSAVDIAKESADIILLDKSLQVLDEGVIEGRKVFGNIIKYIRMGASSNFGNMFSVLGASAWLPFLPMAPVQVIANNLLYDFSQSAIPTDNVDAEYLVAPRRWEIGNIGRYMLFIGPISSIFDYVTFAIMYFGFGASTPQHAAQFQSVWFVESIVTQTLIIHVIRTRRIPFLQSRASLSLTVLSLLVCAAGMYLPYSFLAHSLGFVPLPPTYWSYLAATVVGYLLLTHLTKTWFHRRFGIG
ncbi:MAG TPA: magnesium-translocating P-type ATPase [Steroidobacteraceae bacterium]|nr:magnesium-translocating P-type ATPase [Steroidobacteraceae bacterium]